MPDLASVLLTGRLSKDPTVRFTSKGTALCMISVAVEYLPKAGDKEVSFFDVVVWGKTGEMIGNQSKKGDRISVSGRLRQRSWDQDGVRRYKIEVVADAVFTGPAIHSKADGTPDGTPPAGRPSGGTPPPDDDIPF